MPLWNLLYWGKQIINKEMSKFNLFQESNIPGREVEITGWLGQGAI